MVIFGRTGVGISSLVNLISGYSTSNDYKHPGTTPLKISPRVVSFPNSNKQFWLYNVPGFGGRIQDKTIIEMIRQTERDKGIDLLIYCFRRQRATVLPDIVRRIRDSVPQRVPMIAVVTELERFEPEMDEWWDVVLDIDGSTNGTVVERMCFGEDLRGGKFNAHACITTLPLDKADLTKKLRKRRDLSEDKIRRLILEHCSGPKRGKW